MSNTVEQFVIKYEASQGGPIHYWTGTTWHFVAWRSALYTYDEAKAALDALVKSSPTIAKDVSVSPDPIWLMRRELELHLAGGDADL